MNLFFNTNPETAIQAIDDSRDEAWNAFAKVNAITPEIDQVAYEITQKVFKAGFMAGAQFVLRQVTEEFRKARPNPTEPSK